MEHCINGEQNSTQFGLIEANKYSGGIVGAAGKDDAGYYDTDPSNPVALITDCVNYGTIDSNGPGVGASGDTDMGGIVGITKSSVKNCTNYGTLYNRRTTGGIAGAGVNGGVISGCQNYGTINGEDDTSQAGGVIGYGNINIENCHNYGEVKGIKHVGGITGISYKAIKDCTNNTNGKVSGNDHVGGIVGNAAQSSGKITYCTNNAEITISNEYGGGIAGASQAPIDNCSNTKKITGYRGCAGIVGAAYGIVTNCNNSGEIYCSDDYGYIISGIVGTAFANIDRCNNTGKITKGGIAIGGIVGSVADGRTINVTNCENHGDINAPVSAGTAGIVGMYVGSGTVSSCKTYSTITGESCVAGIVGAGTVTSITNCTNSGTINAHLNDDNGQRDLSVYNILENTIAWDSNNSQNNSANNSETYGREYESNSNIFQDWTERQWFAGMIYGGLELNVSFSGNNFSSGTMNCSDTNTYYYAKFCVSGYAPNNHYELTKTRRKVSAKNTLESAIIRIPFIGGNWSTYFTETIIQTKTGTHKDDWAPNAATAKNAKFNNLFI